MIKQNYVQKFLVLLMLIFSVSFLAGCQTTIVDTTCEVDWRQFPREKDYLTRPSAEEKVEKNCLWEKRCLSEKHRNPRCPT